MQYIINSFHYADKQSNQTILYLHGWGASYQTMLPLKQDMQKYNELFIDLPGCGKNPDPENPLNIQNYVDLILENFKKHIPHIQFIVGHSFGGKLAIKLAKHLPNLKGLFLLSPAILKGKRSIKYYFKIFKYKLYKKLHWNTSKMGSTDYKNASNVMKKTLVNVVNEDAKKEIKSITIPTLLVWGKADTATPLNMAYKIKKKMQDCEVIPIQGNHFAYLNLNNHVPTILTYFIKEVESHDCC